VERRGRRKGAPSASHWLTSAGVATVVLYARDGCHLCDEARDVLEAVRADVPFELIEVDIATDDDLHRRYLERIPVVEVGGREAFEFFVDAEELRRRLAIVDGP
jgi:glutaredoxin